MFSLIGTFGEGYVPLSETVLTGLTFVGPFLLIYLDRTGLPCVCFCHASTLLSI
ncbi:MULTISPECIES: hypothetical protein [unclassified Haloarcula]|uniref:hypothetical protein n=1 Tax=unclassified Haloarcula TaxID=2624677 RepID=UPI001CDA269A|nr:MULTISPECIES: hypothetical protein [unclassified Haloarcula]